MKSKNEKEVLKSLWGKLKLPYIAGGNVKKEKKKTANADNGLKIPQKSIQRPIISHKLLS